MLLPQKVNLFEAGCNKVKSDTFMYEYLLNKIN